MAFLEDLGRLAARRRGVAHWDAECIATDFAAHILTHRRWQLRAPRSLTSNYLSRAANWFAGQEARRLRRDAFDIDASAEGEAEALPIEAALAARTTAALILVAARHLEREDALLFRLCIIEERDCAAAARILGCQPAACWKRLERLRRRIRTAAGGGAMSKGRARVTLPAPGAFL